MTSQTRKRVVESLKPSETLTHWGWYKMADDIFKTHVWISIEILLGFVPWVPIIFIPAFVQITAGCWPVSLLAHICVSRPQWAQWAQVRAVSADALETLDASTSGGEMVTKFRSCIHIWNRHTEDLSNYLFCLLYSEWFIEEIYYSAIFILFAVPKYHWTGYYVFPYHRCSRHSLW